MGLFIWATDRNTKRYESIYGPLDFTYEEQKEAFKHGFIIGGWAAMDVFLIPAILFIGALAFYCGYQAGG